jgi:hypothetical protein
MAENNHSENELKKAKAKDCAEWERDDLERRQAQERHHARDDL